MEHEYRQFEKQAEKKEAERERAPLSRADFMGGPSIQEGEMFEVLFMVALLVVHKFVVSRPVVRPLRVKVKAKKNR